MQTITISGHDRLLGAAVAALVRDLVPEARVACASEGEGGGPGVVVTIENSGRWLFIAPESGAPSIAAEALSRGASAVTTLSTPVAEFEFALRSLAEGGPGHVPLDVVRWIAGEALERLNPAPVSPPLTARERQILQLVARGYTNAEIASELMITTNTVRTHLHALSVKFEASNRTRMLANARAFAVPEAFDAGGPFTEERASA
jgi:DNA-binding CsgD family transcriptional regulator